VKKTKKTNTEEAKKKEQVTNGSSLHSTRHDKQLASTLLISCVTEHSVRGLTPDGNDSDFNLSEDYDGIIDFHDKPKKVGRPFGPHTSEPYAPRKYNTRPNPSTNGVAYSC